MVAHDSWNRDASYPRVTLLRPCDFSFSAVFAASSSSEARFGWPPEAAEASSGSPPPTSTSCPGAGETTVVSKVSVPSKTDSREVSVSSFVFDAGTSGWSAFDAASTSPLSTSST